MNFSDVTLFIWCSSNIHLIIWYSSQHLIFIWCLSDGHLLFIWYLLSGVILMLIWCSSLSSYKFYSLTLCSSDIHSSLHIYWSSDVLLVFCPSLSSYLGLIFISCIDLKIAKQTPVTEYCFLLFSLFFISLCLPLQSRLLAIMTLL